MSGYVGAIVLTLFWIAVTGSLTVPNVVFGFVLSCLCLYLVRERIRGEISRFRPWPVVVLALIFIRELVLSAWRVARLVTAPKMNLNPCIFAYPLEVKGGFEITLLANLITLTPGTLSVDVSDDRRFLYVHAIDCLDADAAVADIRHTFERRILEAFG